METTIRSARVFDVIVDIGHSSADSFTDIGNIFYKEINDKGINPVLSDIKKTNIAKPLFSFIKKYPLKNEIVTLITSQGSIHSTYTETYYFPPLNIWNNPHHGAFVHTEEILESGLNAEDYKNTQNGLVIKTLKDKGLDITLGTYFKELENIRPLQAYEGDTILEGRFGNSIRFGATTDPTIPTITNKWSNGGSIGDPITIIRNGQKRNISTKEYTFISEDVDNDDSSIYLTSNQQLTDFTPSSIYFKSWGANLEETKRTILSPSINQQIEPEIIEQPLPEKEEPVFVEPVVPPLEDIEEEINERTFEDETNITEYNTDINIGITPFSPITLNKGTLKFKIISEEKDPDFIEFQEINLDQPIGANFILKHLIYSDTAAKPELGIHEDADLERVGIYFYQTGESPTGAIQGYYKKDIIGFYHVDGGFKQFIEVKDSDMNLIYKTPGSFSMTLQSHLEYAEIAIFSAGSMYYNYNHPNPGINNYPGIDSDLISGEEIVSNLKKVMENCIDKIYEAYPTLEIISAYRSVEVDTAIDASAGLDHVKGHAIDFRVPGLTTAEIFNWCADNIEEWKDLMWAYPEREADSWVHISYIEGENENHTTLATEMDHLHEWYEGDRRGSAQQYQDGILGANHSLICASGTEGGGTSAGGENSGFDGCVEETGAPTGPVGDGELLNPIQEKIYLSGTPYQIGSTTKRKHKALDLGAKTGTKFYAPGNGKMRWKGDCKSMDPVLYKNEVINGIAACNGGCGALLGVTDMQHSNGDKIDIHTCHAWKPAMHPTENRELKTGDEVTKGQHIGYSGGGTMDGGTWSTPTNSKSYGFPDERCYKNKGFTMPMWPGSPHLHYVMKINGVIQPAWYHLTHQSEADEYESKQKEKYKKWDGTESPKWKYLDPFSTPFNSSNMT